MPMPDEIPQGNFATWLIAVIVLGMVLGAGVMLWVVILRMLHLMGLL